ncbi:MAG: cysteine--tRNA ligase, partial [Candidatus Thermoplasmatota archaeon]
MPLRVHNTRSRRKALFRADGPVRMYVCGPPVYAPSPMGPARSYVAFDVVRRYLEFLDHPVRLVVNVTDVEDSITKRAQEAGVPPQTLAAKFTDAWLADLRALGVKAADVYPRVSEHVPEILAVAEDLVAAGKAYVADGSVYLDTRGEGFGLLSHADLREALVDDAPTGGRRHPLDFVIWKKAKPGALAWESP